MSLIDSQIQIWIYNTVEQHDSAVNWRASLKHRKNIFRICGRKNNVKKKFKPLQGQKQTSNISNIFNEMSAHWQFVLSFH